ncbi:hypothetical protein G6F50_016331 [Rhizopus delemar]|uniref:Uncharacterized protein n=1 Tax=Rhizopus delemar TaxID=936053 RepID=A0A9P7C2G1_9FUNG|nr:hypothetical protein G6F50_016331 [Rhizopus delemar]
MGVFDNGRGRLGVMGTLAQSSATSRSELTGYSAKGKVEGGALGVYGSWNNDALAKAWPRSATIRISGRARWKPVTASASARSAAPP